MTTNTVGNIGLYMVNGEAGNVGMPGAPIMHFTLLVNAPTGAVTGQAVITQAIQGPMGNVHVGNITGQVHATGLGQYTKVVALQGSAVVSVPPPAIGSYLVPFSANFAVDDAWNGNGSWTLGTNTVSNVPVKSL